MLSSLSHTHCTDALCLHTLRLLAFCMQKSSPVSQPLFPCHSQTKLLSQSRPTITALMTKIMGNGPSGQKHLQWFWTPDGWEPLFKCPSLLLKWEQSCQLAFLASDRATVESVPFVHWVTVFPQYSLGGEFHFYFCRVRWEWGNETQIIRCLRGSECVFLCMCVLLFVGCNNEWPQCPEIAISTRQCVARSLWEGWSDLCASHKEKERGEFKGVGSRWKDTMSLCDPEIKRGKGNSRFEIRDVEMLSTTQIRLHYFSYSWNTQTWKES